MTQQEALDILKLGHNVYLTGQAGSGKTYVLNQYIDYLKKNEVAVAVTASTGIAATHMNGITIHSWSGLGVRDYLSDYDLEAMEEKRYLWDRIQNTHVLIIDEVSMLHHFRLDMVEKIVRTFKRNNDCFGGMQVILCGDFFQLPPVGRSGEEASEFIYKSESWKNLGLRVLYLHEQFRQKDAKALEVLNAIRSNRVSDSIRQHLRDRLGKESLSTIEPTRLYTHNIDVDKVNAEELNKLPGAPKEYYMNSRGLQPLVETLKKSCLAPERLFLKKGTRVMFVKNNYDAGYVNGTLGVVTDFKDDGPVVRTQHGTIVASGVSWSIEEEGKVKAEITQVPLRLAWAITVHKSQGMSLDAIEVDLSKSFEKGMGYVALSRVRSLDGLKLLGINQNAIEVNDEVLEFDQELQERSEEAVDELSKLYSDEKTALQKEFLAQIAPIKKEKKKKRSTALATLDLALEEFSLKEIAAKRELNVGTILDHLEKIVEENKADPHLAFDHLKPKRFAAIKEAFEKVHRKTGGMNLTPARDILGPSYDFIELRLARLFLSKK